MFNLLLYKFNSDFISSEFVTIFYDFGFKNGLIFIMCSTTNNHMRNLEFMSTN